MRGLETSKRELDDYLEFIKGTEHPAGYDQQKLFSEVFGNPDRMADIRGAYMLAFVMGGPDAALLSLFGTAFQMGREFESRRREQKELEKMCK